jgi:hypothetical protein
MKRFALCALLALLALAVAANATPITEEQSVEAAMPHEDIADDETDLPAAEEDVEEDEDTDDTHDQLTKLMEELSNEDVQETRHNSETQSILKTLKVVRDRILGEISAAKKSHKQTVDNWDKKVKTSRKNYDDSRAKADKFQREELKLKGEWEATKDARTKAIKTSKTDMDKLDTDKDNELKLVHNLECMVHELSGDKNAHNACKKRSHRQGPCSGYMHKGVCLVGSVITRNSDKVPKGCSPYHPSASWTKQDYVDICYNIGQQVGKSYMSRTRCGRVDTDRDGGRCSNFKATLSFETQKSQTHPDVYVDSRTFSYNPVSRGNPNCRLDFYNNNEAVAVYACQ